MVWGTNDLGKDALGNSTVRDPSSPSYSLLYAGIEICLASALIPFQCLIITTLGKMPTASTRCKTEAGPAHFHSSVSDMKKTNVFVPYYEK